MSAVQVRGLSVSYNGTRVVADADLDVGKGEWVGLVGPNGAGKSTLLRAMAGSVRSSGTVVLLGRSQRSRREWAKSVALVPQQPLMPAGMKVVDYVLLGRTPHIGFLATESAEDVDVAADVLRRLDLVGLAQRQVDTLSGGEAQRAILARALVQESPVLLLDEPSAALDIGHQQEVFNLIDRSRAEQGLAVISAVHDLTLAARFCDRLVVMFEGAIVADGAPREVVTAETVRRYFNASVKVIDDDEVGLVVVPLQETATPKMRPTV